MATILWYVSSRVTLAERGVETQLAARITQKNYGDAELVTTVPQ